MSVRNLDGLFKPRSVAVIGASLKPSGLGTVALRNVVEGGFDGPVWPLNPKYRKLMGLTCHAKLDDLPGAPDLAVICTPPATIAGLIRELGRRGTRAAIVLTDGLDEHKTSHGKTIRQAMLDAARPHLLRVLGEGGVGLLVPGIGLNASVAHCSARPGKIAFVSQSGALVTGVLDWANTHGIGFSKFVSLGESADVDLGDLLDYLAADVDTAAILLYMEGVRHARKFMSAARVAARGKPVIVLKAGRTIDGGASSHIGALAASDAVYDAAIRRAGMLRVDSTEDLFGAAETLARAKPQHGERLALMGNGGGLSLIATDALIGAGGRLAILSEPTLARIGRAWAPARAPHANPLNIAGNAPLALHVAAFEALLAEPQADALLLLHAPSAFVPSAEIANALAPLARAAGANVLACWLGGGEADAARAIFAAAGIPTYDTPEKAVRGFMQMVQYQRNQDLLMEVPAAAPVAAAPRRERVRAIVAQALACGQSVLNECQSKTVLAAYGVPVVETRLAADLTQALFYADEIGYPVALKINAPALDDKAEVGGVVLDLDNADMLRAAAGAMLERVGRLRPDVAPHGFAVQRMARRRQAQELIVGVADDPVFGPVVLVGQGGVAAEAAADHAIGLPPLNMALARDMVARTRVARLLAGYRDHPPADLEALCGALVQVAELAADLGELVELDINPLLVDAAGVVALNARIRLAPDGRAERLAIRPYPQELEQQIVWQGQPLTLRPIRPEDAPRHLAFFNALAADDVRLRFFSSMRELPPSQLARLTQIDYDRAMAFIATRRNAAGEAETLGVVRAVADPDNLGAEFAIVVRSDLKGQGLGAVLFAKLVEYFRGRGTAFLCGETMSENFGMQKLVKKFGGQCQPSAEPGVVNLRIDLQPLVR
jgi:acetyltransferase